MAVITVRISDELKKRMERFRHMNWSEVVRASIISILRQEESRNIAKAVLLNERSVIVPDGGYRSVDAIREWRGRVRWTR
jgi:hypothetical protein